MTNAIPGFDSRRPIRTIYRVSGTTPFRLGLIIVFFLLKHSPVWVMPLAVGGMFAALEHRTADSAFWLILWAALLIGLLIQNVPSNLIYYQLMSRRVRVLEQRLRSALVHRLQHLAISFHGETESGRLHGKILRDVEAIEQVARNVMERVLLVVVSAVIIVVYTVVVEPRILLALAVAFPLGWILYRRFSGRVKAAYAGFRKAIEQMSAHVAEMLDLLPVTRVHGLESRAVAAMDTDFQKIHDQGLELDRTQAVYGASSWLSMQLMIQAVFLTAVWWCWQGSVSLAQLVVFQGLAGSLANALYNAMDLMPMLARGSDTMRSLGEILEATDLEPNDGRRHIDRVEGRIEFTGVGFRYAGQAAAAVSDLSFTIPAGSCTAFVGASGSGKSTTINLLIGLHRPQVGKVLLDGIDAEELDLRSWRRHIAVVSQAVVLFSGSLRDNILYGLDDISPQRLKDAVSAANLDDLVDSLPQGLDTRVGENGVKLSGGQRQRVAIARAMVRDPRIIILDEATSALDVINERLVQEAIERLAQGRTILIVAHRLSTIRMAQQILVLDQGRIIERGSHQELMEANGAFAATVRKQL